MRPGEKANHSAWAYIQQSLDFHGTPVTLDGDMPNGHYKFNIGWVEPLGLKNSSLFSSTHLTPLGEAFISPYTMYGGLFFQLKFINWIEIGAGYRRFFFQKTLVSYTSLPDKSQWAPRRLMELLLDGNGKFAGADVFIFRTNFEFSNNWFQFTAFGSSELWNADVQKGHPYVYEYSSDLLIEAQDIVYRFNTGLEFVPGKTWSPIVENHYLYSKKTELSKDKILAGFRNIPLGKTSAFFIGVRGGYWMDHPQIEPGDVFSRLIFSGQLHWRVLFEKT